MWYFAPIGTEEEISEGRAVRNLCIRAKPTTNLMVLFGRINRHATNFVESLKVSSANNFDLRSLQGAALHKFRTTSAKYTGYNTFSPPSSS